MFKHVSKKHLGNILLWLALGLTFIFSLFTHSNQIPGWAWRLIVGIIFSCGLVLRWEQRLALKWLGKICIGLPIYLGGFSLFSDLSKKPLWWMGLLFILIIGFLVKRKI